MNEWLMILMMMCGGTLFAAGGTDIPKIGGQKWLRRFVLPSVIGLLAFLSHIVWWKCLILTTGLMVAFHLPYGERSSYFIKMLTAISFILPTLILGLSIWQIITPLNFLLMFYCSNNKYLSRFFPWKVVEFSVGVCIAITVVQLLNR